MPDFKHPLAQTLSQTSDQRFFKKCRNPLSFVSKELSEVYQLKYPILLEEIISLDNEIKLHASDEEKEDIRKLFQCVLNDGNDDIQGMIVAAKKITQSGHFTLQQLFVDSGIKPNPLIQNKRVKTLLEVLFERGGVELLDQIDDGLVEIFCTPLFNILVAKNEPHQAEMLLQRFPEKREHILTMGSDSPVITALVSGNFAMADWLAERYGDQFESLVFYDHGAKFCRVLPLNGLVDAAKWLLSKIPSERRFELLMSHGRDQLGSAFYDATLRTIPEIVEGFGLETDDSFIRFLMSVTPDKIINSTDGLADFLQTNHITREQYPFDLQALLDLMSLPHLTPETAFDRQNIEKFVNAFNGPKDSHCINLELERTRILDKLGLPTESADETHTQKLGI